MGRLLLAAAVLLAACGGGAAPGEDGSGDSGPAGPVDAATWAALEAKPLDLKPLEAGASCPLSDSAMLTGSATGLAFGPGPVYAVPGGPFIVLAAKGADGRSIANIQFIAGPDYKGPAVIRGKRIDAEGDVTLDGKPIARFDTQMDGAVGDSTQGSAVGWRYLRTTASFPGPGCYGFQVDTPNKAVSITLKAA